MSEPLHYRLAINTATKCKAKGCYNTRENLSGYCKAHRTLAMGVRRHGWPNGRRIWPKEYLLETNQVTDIINANLSHEGIKTGIQFFDRYLSLSQNGIKTPGGSFIAKVADHGFTGKDLLIEAAAVWLFADRNPGLVPQSLDGMPTNLPLDSVTGRCLALITHRAAGRGNKIGQTKLPKRDAVKIGEYVRVNLGTLLLNIMKSVNDKEKAEQERLLAQAEPLSV